LIEFLFTKTLSEIRKMIAKISVGKGLRGALNYDFSHSKDGQPRARLVAGSLNGTPRQMAEQAAPFRALRPEIKNPIWRCSLSLPPAERQISDSDWQKIAQNFLEEMGADPTKFAWCAIRHDDRDHDHIHISLVRIQSDGQLFDRARDVPRAIAATKKLEQKHQLLTHPRPGDDRPRSTDSPTQPNQTKGKKMSVIQKIQTAVDQILIDHPKIDFAELKDELKKRGIVIEAARTKSGKLQGVRYQINSDDGKSSPPISGSAIGRDYSLGLAERGVDFDQSADELPPEMMQIAKAPSLSPSLRALENFIAGGQLVAPSILAPRPQWAQDFIQETIQKTRPAPPAPAAAPALSMAGLEAFAASGPLATIGVAIAALGIASAIALLSFLKRALIGFNIKLEGEVQKNEDGNAEFVDGKVEKINPHRPTNEADAAIFIYECETAVSASAPGALPISRLAWQERFAVKAAMVHEKVELDFGLLPGEIHLLPQTIEQLRLATQGKTKIPKTELDVLAARMQKALFFARKNGQQLDPQTQKYLDEAIVKVAKNPGMQELIGVVDQVKNQVWSEAQRRLLVAQDESDFGGGEGVETQASKASDSAELPR
jgi:hypothetical protein